MDRKIGHKSAMSIRKSFMDRDEPAHLVDQTIHDMEGNGDEISEGGKVMYQLFAASLLVIGASMISVSVYMYFLHG